MNAISRTTNGKATQGAAMRLLYFLFWYCITHNLDCFSFMIRTGRNITPDFSPLASHTEIAVWAQIYEMARIALPRWRLELTKLGPPWNWEAETITLIKEAQSNDAFNWNNRILEWNPTNGLLSNVMKEEGILRRAAEVQSVRLLAQLISDGFAHADGSEVCVFGHPKTPLAMGKFANYARSLKIFAVITITPSVVIPDISPTPSFWTHVLWVDSAVFGGVLGGSWNIANRCKCRLWKIRQTPMWAHVGNISDVYFRMCLSVGGAMEGVERRISLANSGAMIVIVETPGERDRLSGESQIAPLTLKETREGVFQWPNDFGGQMEISLVREIV